MLLKLNEKFKGVFFYILHLFLSLTCDSLTKFLIKDLEIWEIIFFRLSIGTLILLPIFLINSKKYKFKTNNLFLHFLRGTIFFFAISLWSLGYKYSFLATGTLMAFTIPIFVLIMGPIFLKEKVTKELWIATFLCFLGVLLILNPTKQNFNYYILLFLIASILFAFLDILNKKIINKESMINMLFYSSLLGCFYVMYPAYTSWVTPNIFQVFLLMILGIIGNLTLYFILKSFSYANITFLVPFRYFEIILSFLGGWIIFNEILPKNLIIGACLIIPSALYISLKKK